MSNALPQEDHTGPIKTPKQLLLAVFFSFVVPVLAIFALVAFVVSGAKPAGSSQAEAMALAGVSKQGNDRAIAQRLQKVGTVDIRDANRVLKGGAEVFKAQCGVCHEAGVAGAPKMGDTAAWAPRIKTGYDAMLTSVLKGKGNMGAQAGGDHEDAELARAVVYMANASGAKFAEPAAPAAAASAPVAAALAGK